MLFLSLDQYYRKSRPQPFRRASGIIVAFVAMLVATSCTKGSKVISMKNQGAESVDVNTTTAEDGSTTGTIAKNATATQRMSAGAGSGIDGAQVLFPAGALVVDARVTMAQGSNNANDALAAALGLGSGFAGAGSAVVLTSTPPTDTVNPMQLVLPPPSSAKLSLTGSDDQTWAVLYESLKVGENGTYYSGIIPRSEFTVKDGKVVVTAKHFGTYQTVIPKVEVKAKIELPGRAADIIASAKVPKPNLTASRSYKAMFDAVISVSAAKNFAEKFKYFRFTMDGTTPNCTSSEALVAITSNDTISAVLTINGNDTKTLKVITCINTGEYSEEASATYTFDDVPPTISAVSFSPASPSVQSNPKVNMTLSEASPVVFYKDSCSGNPLTTAVGVLGVNAITVNVPTNITTLIYAQATDGAGNTSACTQIGAYLHDSLAPLTPVISDTSKSFNAAFTTTVQQGVPGDVNFKEFRYTTNGTDPSCATGNASATQPSSISIPASTTTLKVIACDQVGLSSPVATSVFTYDHTAPSVSITSTAGAATNVSPIPVTITFSESVTEFVDADVSVTNGTKSGFSGSGSTYTVNVSPDGQGSVKINIAAGVAQDLAGNDNVAATELIVTYDTTPPTSPSLQINGTGGYTSSTAATLTLAAGDASNMYITNTSGCASGGTWETFSTTKPWTLAQTNAVATVYAKFKDAVGNQTACINGTITHDNTAPLAPVISVPTKSFNAAFQSSVSQNASTDVNFKEFRYTTNGTDPTCSSGTSLTTPAPTVSIPAATTTLKVITCDQVGLASPVSTAVYTFDNVAPTVSITSSASDFTKNSPIPITVTFSKGVSNFIAADVAVVNGAISNFAGSGATYTFDITPSAQGAVTVNIAAEVAQDEAGNNNTAATGFSRTYDTLAPQVSTFSAAGGQANTVSVVSAASPVSFQVIFNESIDPASFTASDINNGLSGPSVTWTVSVVTNTYNKTWDIKAVAATGGGQIKPVLAAGSVVDMAGNSLAAASSSTSAVTYNATVTDIYGNLSKSSARQVVYDGSKHWFFWTDSAGQVMYGSAADGAALVEKGFVEVPQSWGSGTRVNVLSDQIGVRGIAVAGGYYVVLTVLRNQQAKFTVGEVGTSNGTISFRNLEEVPGPLNVKDFDIGIFNNYLIFFKLASHSVDKPYSVYGFLSDKTIDQIYANEIFAPTPLDTLGANVPSSSGYVDITVTERTAADALITITSIDGSLSGYNCPNVSSGSSCTLLPGTGSTVSMLAGNSGVNSGGRINVLKVIKGELYAGGSFYVIGGVPAKNIAKWNGQRWMPIGAGVDGEVLAIEFLNGKIYAAGSVISGGNYKVATWGGATWSLETENFTATIRAFATDGNSLYVGGDFLGIKKLNAGTWSAISGVPATLSEKIYSLAWQNGVLYAGGAIGSYLRKYSGGSWSPVSSFLNGSVKTIAPEGNAGLLIGGDFTVVGASSSLSAIRLARYDTALSAWESLSENNTVFDATVTGAFRDESGEYFAVGNFNGGIKRCLISCNLATSWSILGNGVSASSDQRSVVKYRSQVFVGGGFKIADNSAVADVFANGVAKYSDGVWSSVGDGMSGPVRKSLKFGSSNPPDKTLYLTFAGEAYNNVVSPSGLFIQQKIPPAERDSIVPILAITTAGFEGGTILDVTTSGDDVFVLATVSGFSSKTGIMKLYRDGVNWLWHNTVIAQTAQACDSGRILHDATVDYWSCTSGTAGSFTTKIFKYSSQLGTAPISGVVYDLQVQGSYVFVAGKGNDNIGFLHYLNYSMSGAFQSLLSLASLSLAPGTKINSLEFVNGGAGSGTLYFAGLFSASVALDPYQNIGAFVLSGLNSPLSLTTRKNLFGGLPGEVKSIASMGSKIVAGGNFTHKGSMNLAVWDPNITVSNDKWVAVGSGLNLLPTGVSRGVTEALVYGDFGVASVGALSGIVDKVTSYSVTNVDGTIYALYSKDLTGEVMYVYLSPSSESWQYVATATTGAVGVSVSNYSSEPFFTWVDSGGLYYKYGINGSIVTKYSASDLSLPALPVAVNTGSVPLLFNRGIGSNLIKLDQFVPAN